MECDRKLVLSVIKGRGRIGICKNIIRRLGGPSYITIRIRSDGRAMLIEPCERDDCMSFKVPDDLLTVSRLEFRIYSTSFVRTIRAINGLDENITNNFCGYYCANENVVVVPFVEQPEAHKAEAVPPSQ